MSMIIDTVGENHFVFDSFVFNHYIIYIVDLEQTQILTDLLHSIQTLIVIY
jgi:hypothetical protein